MAGAAGSAAKQVPLGGALRFSRPTELTPLVRGLINLLFLLMFYPF